jgi:hypothetical protein
MEINKIIKKEEMRRGRCQIEEKEECTEYTIMSPQTISNESNVSATNSILLIYI